MPAAVQANSHTGNPMAALVPNSIGSGASDWRPGGRGYDSTINGRFEFFDHTADMGVRVWAPTLAELVRPAIDGLYTIIGTLVPAAPAVPRRSRLG